MTLRILHIGKFFAPQHGGIEVFLEDLIRAQRASGIDACALVHGQPLPDDPDWLVRVPVQAQLVYAPIALGFRAALATAIKRFDPQARRIGNLDKAILHQRFGETHGDIIPPGDID